MSTTGKRTVGWQHPSLLPGAAGARGPGREAYVRASSATWRLIGSPGYPQTDEQVRDRAVETYDRGRERQRRDAPDAGRAHPAQPRRRGCAACACPPWWSTASPTRWCTCPGGRATAAAIPGAELLLIDGMGHDLPRALYETFADAIRRTADRAGGPRRPAERRRPTGLRVCDDPVVQLPWEVDRNSRRNATEM